MFYWNRSYVTTVLFFSHTERSTQHGRGGNKSNGKMEYGTDFLWKQLSFSVKFKHNTHSTIKLARPDYQSRWSSNCLTYFFPKSPDFWPNVFTLQAPCCKTELSSFKLELQVSSKHKKLSIQWTNGENRHELLNVMNESTVA